MSPMVSMKSSVDGNPLEHLNVLEDLFHQKGFLW